MLSAAPLLQGCANPPLPEPPLPETTCAHLLTDKADERARFTAAGEALPEDDTLHHLRQGALLWGIQTAGERPLYCVGLEGDAPLSQELLAELALSTGASIVPESDCSIDSEGVTFGEERGALISLQAICLEDPDRAVVYMSVFHRDHVASGTYADVIRDAAGIWTVVDAFLIWVS